MSFKQYMSFMAAVCLALIIVIVVLAKLTVDEVTTGRPSTSVEATPLKVVVQPPDTVVDYPKPEHVIAARKDTADDSLVEVRGQ